MKKIDIKDILVLHHRHLKFDELLKKEFELFKQKKKINKNIMELF